MQSEHKQTSVSPQTQNASVNKNNLFEQVTNLAREFNKTELLKLIRPRLVVHNGIDIAENYAQGVARALTKVITSTVFGFGTGSFAITDNQNHTATSGDLVTDDKTLPHINCIKQQNHINYGFHTPTSFLAAEGNSKAVEFLITEFEANINDAVLGSAYANRVDLVTHFHENGADIYFELRGYALANHHEQITELLSQNKNLFFKVIRAYAYAGNIKKIEELIENKIKTTADAIGDEDLRHALLPLFEGGHFDCETNILRILASIQHPLVERIFFSLDTEFGAMDPYITDYIPKSKIMKQQMQEKKINLEQALAWQQTDIQGLFTFVFSTQSNARVFSIVASYLATVTTLEAFHLYHILNFEIARTDLVMDLQQHYQKTGYDFKFFGKRFGDSRASKLIAASQQTTSKDELNALLEKEKENANGRKEKLKEKGKEPNQDEVDDFNLLIAKHGARLKY